MRERDGCIAFVLVECDAEECARGACPRLCSSILIHERTLNVEHARLAHRTWTLLISSMHVAFLDFTYPIPYLEGHFLSGGPIEKFGPIISVA